MCFPTAFATAKKSSGLLKISKLLNAAKEISDTSHPTCLYLTHWQARKQLHYFQGVTSVQSADNHLPPGSCVCLGSENWSWVNDTQSSLPEEKCGTETQISAVTHCIVSSNLFLSQAFCFKG